MPLRTGTRNNVIAGVFVISSAVLAIVISVIVSGAEKHLISMRAYTVRFSIEEGAPGLKSGSPVTLGGQEVGRVTSVELVKGAAGPGGAGTQPTAVDVHVLIRADLTLYEDAWVFLERPLLGNYSTINIANAGTGKVDHFQGASAELEPGETIKGSMAPPAFLAQAGYGPDQARQFKMMVSQASEVVDRIDRVTAKFEGELDPTMAKIRGFADDLQSTSAQFRDKAPMWADRVDQLLAKADEASSKLNASLDHADEAVRGIKDAIESNRASFDRIVANVEQTSDRVNHQTVDLLNDTLEKAGKGSEQFSEAASRFNSLVTQELPNIERMLANLRLASDQIKLTGIEVRRNPWRILYQPKTKELESELFYDAARTYATAVSDLRAASEALKASAGAGPALPDVEKEQAAQLQARLDETFKKYKAAEQELMKQLSEKAR